MSMLLVSVTLALGFGDPPAAKGASLEGKWVIVYAEEGGRRNNAWEQRPATVKGTTLSYEAEGGKTRSMQLKLGPHQSLEATVSGGGDAMEKRKGVYILGQDYLCISLDKGAAKKGEGGSGAGAREAAPGAAPAAVAAQDGSSGDFILILRRLRAKKAPTP